MIRISKRDGIRPLSSSDPRDRAAHCDACLRAAVLCLHRAQPVSSCCSRWWQARLWHVEAYVEFLQRTMMLTCIAVGLAPAFKMRFWNVGAEGQLLIGGLGAVILMRFCCKLPSIPLLILMALLAVAFGAIWGMIPGFFKAKWNANETLFTLMMNYIATQIVLYFCTIWEGTKGTVKIGIINDSKNPAGLHKGWIGEMFTGNFNDKDYMWVVVIVLLVVVLMWVPTCATRSTAMRSPSSAIRRTPRAMPVSASPLFMCAPWRSRVASAASRASSPSPPSPAR